MKAQELAITMVILAVMALAVLLFMTTFLSGGFKSTSEKVTTFGRVSADVSSAGRSVNCNTLCSLWASRRCVGEPLADLKAACTQNEKCKLGTEADCCTTAACKSLCDCPKAQS